MLRIFRMVSAPRPSPRRVATTRRARVGRAMRIAAPRMPSSGMRRNAPGTNAPGLNRASWSGTTSATKTSRPAAAVSVPERMRCRGRSSRRGSAATSSSRLVGSGAGGGRRRVISDNPTILRSGHPTAVRERAYRRVPGGRDRRPRRAARKLVRTLAGFGSSHAGRLLTRRRGRLRPSWLAGDVPRLERVGDPGQGRPQLVLWSIQSSPARVYTSGG